MNIADTQNRVGDINRANGWREHDEADMSDAARVNFHIARLALITTEVAEAIEEIRNGRAVYEEYHTWMGKPVQWRQDGLGVIEHPNPHMAGQSVEFDPQAHPAKPEGVPSELADIVIRALDAADAWGIDLERVIEEKLRYNESRGHRHGGKQV